MQPPAPAAERGLTLVEVIVAVAIIGVGLVALATAIPLSSYGIQEGNQLSTATFLATARLEQVKNATWTATTDNLGVSPGPGAPPQSGATVTFPDETPVAAPYSQYTRTVRIVSCAAGCGVNDADLRQVTVTVSYRPLTGVGQAPASKAAVVTTYIARK
jgi:prepilin-type N-terminal cleavage/methylation domain-containing protein